MTFDKETVEKIGKTFEIISVIKIIQPTDEEESDIEDWDIPSQDRPTEKTQNRAHGEGAGTMGRKYTYSDDKGGYTDRDILIKYFSEREKYGNNVGNDIDTLSVENGSDSVPTSHGNCGPFRCYHHACDFHTDNKLDYENMIARHWQQKHTGIPKLYPTKTELEKYGLQAQGKEWEI